MADTAVAGTFRLADVFSKSVAIYSRRFLQFIILTVIASIPNYLALLLIRVPTTRTEFASIATARVSLTLIDIATKSLASGAVMYGVVQELRGRTFSVGDSILVALRRFLPMVGVAICTTIVIALGIVLLIIPGIMFACMYYVASPVCVAEQAGVFTSMSRSSFLTKGHRWQVFGIFLLLLAGGLALGAILTGTLIWTATRGFVWGSTTGVLITRLALSAIIGAFNGVLMGVLYYELRVDKEGVDIDKIAGVFD
jgi:hypothetical protein